MNPTTTSMPSKSEDSYNLARFLSAQQHSYETALSEVTAGQKRSHWMWYVLPQLKGLGQSSMAQLYGISGTDEAWAYISHEILGPRLIAVCEAVMSVEGRSATEIFGEPDDMKLRSCVTLFAQVSNADSVFQKILVKYFDGHADRRTMQLLERG